VTAGPHVLVAGSYGLSMRYVAERPPEAGETLIAEGVFADHGGKGSNQAIAAARLGATVDFLTAVGDDAAGDEAIALWRREGVQATAVRVRGRATMTGSIIVDRSGENRIIVGLGAMASLDEGDARLAKPLLTPATTVVVQNEAPLAFTRRILELAREAGALTIYNPAPAIDLLEAGELWPLVDYLVPNASEAARILGDAAVAPGPELAEQLAARTGCRVVLTLGSGGAVVASAGGTEYTPARSVEAVDTTGAGDCFTAALAVALAGGTTDGEAVRFATLAASRAVQRPGVLDGLPRYNELAADAWAGTG
jgi:ribokinase